MTLATRFVILFNMQISRSGKATPAESPVRGRLVGRRKSGLAELCPARQQEEEVQTSELFVSDGPRGAGSLHEKTLEGKVGG